MDQVSRVAKINAVVEVVGAVLGALPTADRGVAVSYLAASYIAGITSDPKKRESALGLLLVSIEMLMEASEDKPGGAPH